MRTRVKKLNEKELEHEDQSGFVYVAIFEGTAIEPLAPLPDSGSSPVQFNWAYILVPLGVVFAAGGVIGGCLLYKRRHENDEEGSE